MPQGSVTLLTQNAWGGAPFWAKRRELLARLFRDLRPDIIGLQEIHAPNVSGEGNQADELAALAGGYETMFAPGRVEARGHCEGVALLLRSGARVLERSIVPLSRDEADSLDGPYPRVALRAAVALPEADAVVDVMVTHLSLSKRARSRTVPEICALAPSPLASEGCSIVMGDLNATPDDPSLATFGAAGFVDAWQTMYGEARGGTWPAGVPFRRIDYVFVRPRAGFGLVSCERTPVAGSDHVGLMVRIGRP